MSIIKMKGKDDQDIYVEVVDKTSVNTRGISILSENVGEKAQGYAKQFSRVGDYIMNVCAEIYDKYKATAKEIKPEEIEIQFGIKLSGETGIPFVSKGAAEATIQVKAKWVKSKD